MRAAATLPLRSGAPGSASPGPRVRTTLMYSLGVHIFIFIIIPLATHLLWKPRKFERPATFQLVSPPKAMRKTAQEKVRRSAPKKEQAVRPATSKGPAPSQKKAPDNTEDLSELEDLLGGLQQPISSISFAGDFKYHWYIRNLQAKVEQNWRPSVNDPAMMVVVQFTILPDGSISPVRIKRSSGSDIIDKQAVRAIEQAAPFGKLPPQFSGNLECEYILRPTTRS